MHNSKATPKFDSEWWLLVAAAVVAVMFVTIAAVFAHDAPGGWHYPSQCCSPDDTQQLCHPVECDEIGRDSIGNYTWRDLRFTSQQVFSTQDDKCHACNSWTNSGATRKPDRPYCLFIRSSS